MKKLSRADVKISKLKLPGDMRKRAESTQVSGLADSLTRVGLLHNPVVRKADKKVLSGRDRIAACMANGDETVEVLYVDCTDDEAAEIKIAENVYRRTYTADARARMIADLYKRIQSETDSPSEPEPGPRKRGRPKGARGKAITQVASEYGVSESAVLKAEREAKDKLNTPVLESPINAFGLPLTNDFIAEMIIVRRYIDDSQVRTRTATASLTMLEKADTSVPIWRVQAIKESLQAVYQELQHLKPASVCPYCKGISPYQDECSACKKTGWVGSNIMEVCDPVLLSTEVPTIMVCGEIVPLSDVYTPDADEAPADSEDPAEQLDWEEIF